MSSARSHGNIFLWDDKKKLHIVAINSEEDECDTLVRNQARLIDQYKRTIDQYETLISKINGINPPCQQEKIVRFQILFLIYLNIIK